ncbi:MAG: hypothetical protein RLZZ568_1090 [Cyanobacteriota bacterium]|jgi:hypothetical protein
MQYYIYKPQPLNAMNDNIASTSRDSEKVEVSIQLDSNLLDQLQHLTNDPSRIIETAVKQWLRGEQDRDDELTRTLRRNPPVPPRGEWND